MIDGHARARDGGDFVVAALATVLGRTRDRLAAEGMADAAELVADLAEAAHDYLARHPLPLGGDGASCTDGPDFDPRVHLGGDGGELY